jgi:glycosyltransferase involved in cell wall biosynthesis
MLVLMRALQARGHQVALACPEPPDAQERSLAGEARASGFAPVLTLSRARGARWLRDRHDARALARHLDAHPVDRLHCWHTRDQWLAWRALRGRGDGTRLVRSLSQAGGASRLPWHRWWLGRACSGLLCVGEASAAAYRKVRRDGAVAGVLGAVDCAPFEAADGARARSRLGIPANAPVVGIVARVQPRRRFDLLFAAFAKLAPQQPEARLLLVGRGTRFEELAAKPARELGLSERVVMPGYLSGRDYFDALCAMDVFTYLVPGSDGSCRALLEAMAAGVPAVTSRRGALPEIVEEGSTGWLVPEDAQALADGWNRLIVDPERRRRMGAAAAHRARQRFSPDQLARQVEAFYASLGDGPASESASRSR